MESRESTPGSQDRPYLGDSINIATRSVHTKLNRSILAHLPHALPPRARNPSIYVSGLLHIAPVYLAFESLWKDILDRHEENGVGRHGDVDEPVPDMETSYDFGAVNSTLLTQSLTSEQIHSVLSSLHLPDLMRSESLLLDIRTITGWPADVVNDEIKALAQTGHLGAFIAHINRSVTKQPHVLIAYAWVLYMALFSGGRFIRATLESAGPSFWTATSDPVQPSNRACSAPSTAQQTSPSSPDDLENNPNPLPLNFFRFPTPQDGEDLKQTFKSRLRETQILLTPEEHGHVVREAVCLFDHMNLLVAQLESTFTTNTTVDSGAAGGGGRSWANMLGRRIRDSVAVARERGLGVLGRKGKVDEPAKDGDGQVNGGVEKEKTVRFEAEPVVLNGEGGYLEEKAVSVEKSVLVEAESPARGGEEGVRKVGVEISVWNVAAVLTMVGVGLGVRYAWRS